MSDQKSKSDIELYVIRKVKLMREERGVSQAQLAYLLDLSIGFIGHVESPKYPAKYNLNHLNKLAKFLSVLQKIFCQRHILYKCVRKRVLFLEIELLSG